MSKLPGLFRFYCQNVHLSAHFIMISIQQTVDECLQLHSHVCASTRFAYKQCQLTERICCPQVCRVQPSELRPRRRREPRGNHPASSNPSPSLPVTTTAPITQPIARAIRFQIHKSEIEHCCVCSTQTTRHRVESGADVTQLFCGKVELCSSGSFRILSFRPMDNSNCE